MGEETHRFIRRLSRLQDRLGALNDGAVAAHLLGELTGGNHAFAIGLVLGFVGARSAYARAHRPGVAEFRRAPPFWE